jgi:8-oxo-dGTP diphosphatase
VASPPHLHVGAAALVEREGCLLLLQRTFEPFAGHWNLPAGYVEPGESPEQAARREALEETGLVVDVIAVDGVYFFADDPRGNGILIAYRCRSAGSDPMPGREATASAWFLPSELPKPLAGGGHDRAVLEWKRRAALGEVEASARPRPGRRP